MQATFSGPLKAAAAALLVLAMAWQHVQATRLGYEVENSRKRVSSLKGRIAVLQVDLQRSLSPAQLALQAKARLGMFPLSPQSLRLIDAPAGSAPQETFLARLFSRLAAS